MRKGDTVAVEIAAFDHPVADIDTNAKRDPLLWIDLSVVFMHRPLNEAAHSTDRVDQAAELGREAGQTRPRVTRPRKSAKG